jgi:hypothetical protein
MFHYKIFLCLFPFLFSLCKSSETVEFSSFSDAFEFIQDPKRTITTFFKTDNLIKFLISHYHIEPVSILNKIFKSNCIPFERIFFSIIRTTYFKCEIPLHLNQRDIFKDIVSSSKKIKKIVPNLLFKPFDSEEEMERRFSIIKFYIKFAKRYIEYSGVESCSDSQKRILLGLLSDVKAWEFAVRFLPMISPHGMAINYKKLFDMFYWILRPNRTTFPKYNEYDLDYSNLQFLFVNVILIMILKKDIDFFKFDHPELPFLVGFMLRYTKFAGNHMFPSGYSHSYYRQLLENFLDRIVNFNLSLKPSSLKHTWQ